MNEVLAIFDAFDGPTNLARGTGFRLQTVCDWRRKGNPEIPPWRRPAVLAAAKSMSIALPDEAVRYLKSDDRRKAGSEC
jgi:hypothetical protein